MKPLKCFLILLTLLLSLPLSSFPANVTASPGQPTIVIGIADSMTGLPFARDPGTPGEPFVVPVFSTIEVQLRLLGPIIMVVSVDVGSITIFSPQDPGEIRGILWDRGIPIHGREITDRGGNCIDIENEFLSPPNVACPPIGEPRDPPRYPSMPTITNEPFGLVQGAWKLVNTQGTVWEQLMLPLCTSPFNTDCVAGLIDTPENQILRLPGEGHAAFVSLGAVLTVVDLPDPQFPGLEDPDNDSVADDCIVQIEGKPDSLWGSDGCVILKRVFQVRRPGSTPIFGTAEIAADENKDGVPEKFVVPFGDALRTFTPASANFTPPPGTPVGPAPGNNPKADPTLCDISHGCDRVDLIADITVQPHPFTAVIRVVYVLIRADGMQFIALTDLVLAPTTDTVQMTVTTRFPRTGSIDSVPLIYKVPRPTLMTSECVGVCPIDPDTGQATGIFNLVETDRATRLKFTVKV